MRMLAETPKAPPRTPTVDEVEFRSLYEKSSYPAITDDGWELVITRYQPTPQDFPQPLLGEVLLLVHGFSQNRHAWTSGEFVKNLLFFSRVMPTLGGHCRRTSTTSGTSTVIS